jgi:hypothetical protein
LVAVYANVKIRKAKFNFQLAAFASKFGRINIDRMKISICHYFVLCFILTALTAQSQEKIIAKNFPEGFVGLEWNTGSALAGINYERYLLEKNQCVIGIKLSHSVDYAEENLVLFSAGPDLWANFNSLTGTLHKFFKPEQQGFFLSTELGGGLRKARYHTLEHSTWFVASGAGLGWQTEFIGKAVMRWSFSLTFEGKGVITAMSLSIGF